MDFLEILTALSPLQAQSFLVGTVGALIITIVVGRFFSHMARVSQAELTLVIPGARQEFLQQTIPMWQGFAKKSWYLTIFFAVVLAIALGMFALVYGTPIPRL